MISVDLVLAALAAGASAGATNVASQAVMDLYQRLRDRLSMHLPGSNDLSLEALESEPDIWQAKLRGSLQRSKAARDPEVLALAQQLLAEVDGYQGAAFLTDARDAKGIQVGSNNTQTNHFS